MRQCSDDDIKPPQDFRTFKWPETCWQSYGSESSTYGIKYLALGAYILDASAEAVDGKVAHVEIMS